MARHAWEAASFAVTGSAFLPDRSRAVLRRVLFWYMAVSTRGRGSSGGAGGGAGGRGGAGRAPGGCPGGLEWAVQRAADAVEKVGKGGGVEVVGEDDELVAAEAGDGVVAADLGQQPGGDFSEGL